jgi:predicted small secreted protein
MRRNILRGLLTVLVVGYGAVNLAACNTVEGAGQDMKAGGAAVENSAHDAKNY